MKTFLIFCIVLTVSGCTDEKLVAITDGKIYTQLKVRFDTDTDITFATAEFWNESPSGKRLIFNGYATLTFQDLPMDYRNTDFTYYKELPKYFSSYTYKFVDVNNKSFTNTVSINPIEFSVFQPLDTIDITQPLTVYWDGQLVGNLETVSLRIEGFVAKQDTVGKNSVTFSLDSFTQLTAFKNTTVKVNLERSKAPGLTADLGGGGVTTLEYISSTKNVYLR